MTRTNIITIEADEIVDWASFHRVFRDALGFPRYYGCNMNAWIDCMSYVDDPDAGMSAISVAPGDVLTLLVDHVPDFMRRCPEQYAALIECTAFVNFRRMDQGKAPVLALMLSGRFPSHD